MIFQSKSDFPFAKSWQCARNSEKKHGGVQYCLPVHRRALDMMARQRCVLNISKKETERMNKKNTHKQTHQINY